MPEQASLAAPEPMAGDLLPHEVGQVLHFGVAYGQPVVCPCGCPATKCITDLKVGDKVEIRNIPFEVCEQFNVPRNAEAVRVGDFNVPAFQFEDVNRGINATISYQQLYCSPESSAIEILVTDIQD